MKTIHSFSNQDADFGFCAGTIKTVSIYLFLLLSNIF